VADEIVHVLGSEIEFAGDVFRALDDEEVALGISDHDVAWWCENVVVLSFWKHDLAFVADADKAGQEAEGDD
jgi:hypothetical protein